MNLMVKMHYEQHTSVPGMLLITEATFIAANAGGEYDIPGIWDREQIDAGKEALGRMARISHLHKETSFFPYTAPSPIPLSRCNGTSRELAIPKIEEYITLFTQVAKNAIEAGFNGVEIDKANGYLLDQCVEDVSNQRMDEYGGHIENRSRLTLEVIDNIVYIHLIQPLDSGLEYADKSNDILRATWFARPLISAGEYTTHSTLDIVEKWDNELLSRT
ncbi:Chanoclavine-I aldehyde reductase [Leucoagaricus sp. SymC.cos]|nr:Chanoclavine-I aldehyde reductase [Leucoagaricus sp. SymC.cos]